MYQINAAFRLFADAHAEAGKVLKSVAKVLGPHFVTNEHEGTQVVVWRTSKFKAALMLDTEEDALTFKFFDKANTGSFEAEGYNYQTLMKDIRYNVSQFKPTKQVPPDIQDLRNKFETIE